MLIGATQLGHLRLLLSEAVQQAPIGTLVGWKVFGGFDYGVVIGRDAKDLLCMAMYDKALQREAGIKHYRDEKLTNELASTILLPGIMMDIQRIPAMRAFRKGIVRGSALKPYLAAAAQLQIESIHPEQLFASDESEASAEATAIQEIANNLGFKIKELDAVEGTYSAKLIGRNNTELQVKIADESISWSVIVHGESIGGGSKSTTQLDEVITQIEAQLTQDASLADREEKAKREVAMASESTYGISGRLAAVHSLLSKLSEAKPVVFEVGDAVTLLPKARASLQAAGVRVGKTGKVTKLDGPWVHVAWAGVKGSFPYKASVLKKGVDEDTAAGDGLDEAAATGKAQQAILKIAQDAKGEWVELTDVKFKKARVHFAQIMSGAEALAKKGLIDYKSDVAGKEGYAFRLKGGVQEAVVDEATDKKNLADTLANEMVSRSKNVTSMVDSKTFVPELVELIMKHLKK